jgi:IclR family KDG regulon transcriptional repressor
MTGQDQQERSHDTPLGRTFRILEGVIACDGPIGPRELSRRIGVERSSVGRTLIRLTELGLLQRVGREYRPGSRLLGMSRALAVRDSLPNASLPILRALSERYDETAYLCLRQGSHGIFVYDVPTTNPVRYVLDLGKSFPLYLGASGRAILSALPDPELDHLLGAMILDPVTRNTITDRVELMRRIESDRATGYSASISERVEGGSAVSAPFRDAEGVCQGSISLTCPLSRLDPKLVPVMGESVREAAESLSVALGYRKHAGRQV